MPPTKPLTCGQENIIRRKIMAISAELDLGMSAERLISILFPPKIIAPKLSRPRPRRK